MAIEPLIAVALFRTRSAALFGIDAHLVDVEVDMYPGIQRDIITVGLPDVAVKESRERIKSALINSGVLAPAAVRKEGAGFDLPMALGILGSSRNAVAERSYHIAEEARAASA